MSLLGVDIGTSGCKAVAFDIEGRQLASAAKNYHRLIPAPGLSEIRPNNITGSVKRTIAEVASQTKKDPIEAVSFSVFGGGFVPLDKQNRPLLNIISTTDNRAGFDADEWVKKYSRRWTYNITGLSPHSSLILIKALMLRRLHPDLFKKICKTVTVKELVFAELGLPIIADRSTAQIYMAYDIRKKGWSEEILEKAGLRQDILPDIADCGSIIGEIGTDVADLLGLSRGVKVVAGGHDQQVAGFGAGLSGPGTAVDSLGTVESIGVVMKKPKLGSAFMNCGFSNLCHVYGGLTFTNVYNFSAADLLNWFGRVFCNARNGRELSTLKPLLASLPKKPASILTLPHFPGSGTPYLDPFSRGAIVGLHFGSTRLEIFRAIVDSQNYEMRFNLEMWRRFGIKTNRLRVYGGLSRSDTLLQIKADILDLEVVRLDNTEMGCFGAAVLAGAGIGRIPDAAAFLEEKVLETKVFTPRSKYREQHEELYQNYRRLYGAVKEINHNLARIQSGLQDR